MRELTLSVLVFACVPLSGCQKPNGPSVPAAKAVRFDIDPCITVRRIGGYGSSKRGVGLILASWRDGRVVYSEDLVNGGPPFRSGMVEPGKIEAFTSAVGSATWFNGGGMNEVHYSCCAAVIRISESQLRLIERYQFDDWLRASPIVPIEELSKSIETNEFNRDSYRRDLDGMTISASEVLGRSMSILIPDNGVPYLTTLELRDF